MCNHKRKCQGTLVKNNLHGFIYSIKCISSNLYYLWECADNNDDHSVERTEAIVFLVKEMHERICSLENFIAESGDLIDLLHEYKSNLDIFQMLADKKKESMNR
ncbi:TPA: hypothetical protein R3998_004506 [Salmonella enterica subsp. enterica serovar Muenchen]|nr:hypothetical protein [Salmonella enterica subsp. enterica serovar Muenchen]